MADYLEPAAIKFIFVFAAVAVIVAIIDAISLMRRKGKALMDGLLPAIDSVIVIAGFMAFVGTGIAFIESALTIANTNINWISTIEPPFGKIDWRLPLKAVISAFVTVIIAWALFFSFFEVWYLLRLLYRKYMKKLQASS